MAGARGRLSSGLTPTTRTRAQSADSSWESIARGARDLDIHQSRTPAAGSEDLPELLDLEADPSGAITTAEKDGDRLSRSKHTGSTTTISDIDTYSNYSATSTQDNTETPTPYRFNFSNSSDHDMRSTASSTTDSTSYSTAPAQPKRMSMRFGDMTHTYTESNLGAALEVFGGRTNIRSACERVSTHRRDNVARNPINRRLPVRFAEPPSHPDSRSQPDVENPLESYQNTSLRRQLNNQALVLVSPKLNARIATFRSRIPRPILLKESRTVQIVQKLEENAASNNSKGDENYSSIEFIETSGFRTDHNPTRMRLQVEKSQPAGGHTEVPNMPLPVAASNSPLLEHPTSNNTSSPINRKKLYWNSPTTPRTQINKIRERQSEIIKRYWRRAESEVPVWDSEEAANGSPPTTLPRVQFKIPGFSINRPEDICRVRTELCELDNEAHSKEDEYHVFSTCYITSSKQGRAIDQSYPFLTTLLEEAKQWLAIKDSENPDIPTKYKPASDMWWQATKELVQWFAIGHKDVLSHRCPENDRTIFEESFTKTEEDVRQERNWRFLWIVHWILECIPSENTMKLLENPKTRRCPSCDKTTEPQLEPAEPVRSDQEASDTTEVPTTASEQDKFSCEIQLPEVLKRYFSKPSAVHPLGLDHQKSANEETTETRHAHADGDSERILCIKECIDVQMLKKHSDALKAVVLQALEQSKRYTDNDNFTENRFHYLTDFLLDIRAFSFSENLKQDDSGTERKHGLQQVLHSDTRLPRHVGVHPTTSGQFDRILVDSDTLDICASGLDDTKRWERHSSQCSAEIYSKIFEIFRGEDSLRREFLSLIAAKNPSGASGSGITTLSLLLRLLSRTSRIFDRYEDKLQEYKFSFESKKEEKFYNTAIRKTIYALIQTSPELCYGGFSRYKRKVRFEPSHWEGHRSEAEDSRFENSNTTTSIEDQWTGMESERGVKKLGLFHDFQPSRPNSPLGSLSRRNSNGPNSDHQSSDSIRFNPYNLLLKTQTEKNVEEGTPSLENLMIRTIVGASEEYLTESDKKIILYTSGNPPRTVKKLLLDLRSVRKEAIDKAYFDCLDEHSKEFELERTLEYVALPEPKVRLPSKELIAKGLDKTVMLELHSPYYYFFTQWLRNKKSVEKIFEVIVEDSRELPHGDEYIIECIKNFDVEIFNWQKLDLSIETVKKAAPNARVVHLYCAGGNSVLQSWAGEEGLVTLEHLERVDVSAYCLRHSLHRDGSDSLSGKSTSHFKCEVDKYLQAFKHKVVSTFRNLRTGRKPVVEVHTRVFSIEDWHRPRLESYIQNGGGLRNTGQFKLFYSRLEHFIKNLKPTEQYINTNMRSALPRSLKTQLLLSKTIKNVIRIAVLDDGIDMTVSGTIKIAKGDSFYASSTRTVDAANGGRAREYKDYFTEPGDHGTQMAHCIMRIFPQAELYVGRLDDRPGLGNSGRFTIASATQAIAWALENKADIISMSWSFLEMDADQKFKDILQKAASKCLLFAASPEADTKEGAMQNAGSPKYLPAGGDGVFVISVANPNADQLNVANDDRVFRFPGSNVIVFEGTSFAKVADGSSVATAIAAGFAGLLLYSMDLVARAGSAAFDPTDNPEEKFAEFVAKYAKAQKFRGMKEVLETLCRTDTGKLLQQKVPNLPLFFPNEDKFPLEDNCARVKELRKLVQKLLERV